MVEWRSPERNLIQFEDSGEVTVNSTSVTLSPLIPGTNYLIKVSAVTPRGRGEQISATGAVLNAALQGRSRFAIGRRLASSTPGPHIIFQLFNALGYTFYYIYVVGY